MKRLIKKSIFDIQRIFNNWEEFEDELRYGEMFEPFEEYYVPINYKNYIIAIEGWYPDCLESVGIGETNRQNIKDNYLSLMEKQFNFISEKHNYIFDSKLCEYGVSYIAKVVDI